MAPLLAGGLLLGVVPGKVEAQCDHFSNQYPEDAMSPVADAGFATLNSCNWAGEYAVVNVVSGDTYIFSTCAADGSNISYDSQLTLRTTTTGALLAYDDDGCAPQSRIEWVSTITGQVEIHLSEFSCASNNTCTEIRVSRIAGGGGGCPAGEIEDCNGNCAPADWVGDGFCDDGSFSHNGNPIFFNCPEFNNDGGDCPPPGEGPENDECANATLVGNGITPFSTIGATGAGNNSCQFNSSNNVWFEYVATCDGFATVNTCDGTNFDTVISAWDACGGNEIICGDDQCGLQSSITFAVTSGTSYWINVAGFNGQTGTGNLTVSCDSDAPSCTVDPPACATDAAAVAQVQAGDTFCCNTAWDEVCEAAYAELSDSCDGGGGCPAGEIEDCNGNCAPADWVGDGFCDDGSFSHNGNPIFFNCPEFNNDGGDCPPSGEGPENDLCTNAEPIAVNAQGTCMGAAITGTTFGAGDETGSSPCDAAGAWTDVWYTFNSGSSGQVVVNATQGTSTDIGVQVFDACGGTSIGCGLIAESGIPYTIPVAGNTDYYVRVFTNTNWGVPGTFTLCVEDGGEVPEAPENDDCASVTPEALATGGSVNFTGTTVGATSAGDGLFVAAPAVWHAFTLSECATVTISYCGTTPAFTSSYAAVTMECPAEVAIGGISDWDFCGNENNHITFVGLEAGTYYFPVAYVAGSADGAYSIDVSAEACPEAGPCLTAPFGLYPSATYTPVCNGAVENITTLGWASEYSNVYLTAGEDYIFSSSVATDWLTIADEDGIVALAYGTTPVAFTATVTGVHRLYHHVDALCNTQNTLRTRSVQCGEIPEPPANDDCASVTPEALEVEGAPLNFTGTTVGATAEAGPFSGNPTVWHAFTLSECATVTVAYCGTSPAFDNVWVNLGTGCPVDGFTPGGSFENTSCGDGNYSVTHVGVEAGTYYIPVGNFGAGTNGDYSLLVTAVACPVPPANDECADAIVLTMAEDCVPVAGSSLLASESEPALTCGTWTSPVANDVWYQFEATSEDAFVELNAAFDATIAFYDGCGSPVGCIDENLSTGVELYAANGLTIGETYYVRIYGWNGATGSFTICVFGAPEPGPCLDAPNGQYPTATVTPNCIGEVETVVTIAWTGEYSMVNLTAGEEYIFSSSISTHWITISDADGTTALAYGTTPVSFTPAAGGEYRFYTHLNALCDYASSSHTRQVLCGDIPSAPENDECANATVVGNGVTPFSTIGATGAGNNSCQANSSNNVWFEYVATCDGFATVNTCDDTTFDTVISAWDACGGNEIICGDDQCGLQSSITFAVTSGTSYWINVAGYNGQTGTGNLTVSCDSDAPSCAATPPACVLEDEAAYQIVIANDSFCCNIDWDLACQNAFDAISDACDTGGPCPFGQIEDCNGNCAPETWLGDGDCDAGQWTFGGNPIFFNCDELNWDDGDCDPNGGCIAEAPACVLSDDAAYQTVIADDSWCCNNEWDNVCQDAFDEISDACATGPCEYDLVLELQTDSWADETSWAIIEDGSGAPVCTGDGYPDNAIVTAACCVAEGCYRLEVYDSFGDGMSLGTGAWATGGYILRTVDGERIIDNGYNFSAFNGSGFGNTTISTLAPGESFCLPLGEDRPIHTSCDRYWWESGNYLVATENTAVSAEFGVTNTTSGYEFWFFDPNGQDDHSFRKFRNHATSDGFSPNNAVRAAHIKLNNWAAANHLQDFRLYNVRIRGVIDGAELPFGPACRVVLDPVEAACTPTGLNDISGHANFSCGVSRTFGGPNSPANRVYARSVAGANRYEFEFSNAGEGYLVSAFSNTVIRHLNWTSQPGLNVGSIYQVRVRASKDGGATWCNWGWTCDVTIAPGVAPGGESFAALGQTGVALWPNPNNGQQLWMQVDGLTDDIRTIAVDIHDLSGKRVVAREVAAQHGAFSLDLNGGIAAGTYVVTITAGDQRHVERLVIAD